MFIPWSPVFCAVLAAALAACAAPGPPLPAEAPDGPPRPSDRRLAEALDALRPGAPARDGLTPDSFLVARLREGGLTPVFGGGAAGGTFRLGPAGAVAALIPGRHPALRDQLVVAAADADNAGAAALLEAARLLAARSTFVPVPERTVLVAFLVPPRKGAEGLADVLAAPVWADSAVARVLRVAQGDATPDAGIVAGRPLWPVRSPASEGDPVGAARALALAAYDALVAAAQGDALTAPDSVAAR